MKRKKNRKSENEIYIRKNGMVYVELPFILFHTVRCSIHNINLVSLNSLSTYRVYTLGISNDNQIVHKAKFHNTINEMKRNENVCISLSCLGVQFVVMILMTITIHRKIEFVYTIWQ